MMWLQSQTRQCASAITLFVAAYVAAALAGFYKGNHTNMSK